jgi:hypothetical protein
MSTTTVAYPNSIRLPRVSILRWFILLIASLALVASFILVLALPATAGSSSGNLADVVAIPVPSALITDNQVLLTETATPAPSPTIIAVPVPIPPSQ